MKISELPQAGPITGAEEVPIVQDGTTDEVSLATLLDAANIHTKATGVGAKSRTLAQARGDVVSLKDYCDGTGADDSVGLQNAINALGASGGAIVVPPGGKYYFGTPLVANAPITWFGWYGDVSANTNGSGVTAATPVFYWTGAVGAKMFTMKPATVGTAIFGGGSVGVSWDGNNAAGIAVAFDNCVASIFDGDVRKVTIAGVDVSSDSGSTTNFSERVRIVRLNFVWGVAAACQGAHGLRLRGNGVNVPATQHQLGEISGLVYNGNLVDIAECDNVKAGKVHGVVQAGGTGAAVRLRAGGAQGAINCLFLYLVGPYVEDAGLHGNHVGHYNSEGGSFNSGSVWHGKLLDYVTGKLYESHRYRLQKKILISSGDWVGDGAAGAQDLGLQWRSVMLPDAATSSASAIVIDDGDLDDGTITGVEIIVGTNGTSGGNYDLRIRCSTAAMDSQSGLVTPAYDTTAVYAAPAQYNMRRYTITFGTPLTYTKGNGLMLRVQRIGADATDTNTDPMNLIAARILYQGKGPHSAGSGTYTIPSW